MSGRFVRLPKPGQAPPPQAAVGRGLTELEKRLATSWLMQTYKNVVNGDDDQLRKYCGQIIDVFSQKVEQHGEPPLEQELIFSLTIRASWLTVLQALRPGQVKAELEAGPGGLVTP